ncbi:MAG: hypothetical protein LUO97_02485 [Methanomicrobiales archaeon]|nr:hypothetical protein [Methanomicrobiales archaeon]
MVKEEAQLYTMEGVAAGLIMLLTAYLVLGSTSVYTPGDTHITDMQLEQVGSDILRVMDTPRTLTGSLKSNRTDLELIVNTTDGTTFSNEFKNTYLCNPKAVAKEISVGCDGIRINASIWYVGTSNSPGSYLVPSPFSGGYLGTGPGVRVSHWVHTIAKPRGTVPADMRTEPQELLVEVLMWKA